MPMQSVLLEVDEYRVYVYGRDDEVKKWLEEARHRGVPLIGPYSYRKDPPHSSTGQYHVHVYKRQNELFALNFDGTAHDQSHGRPIPGRVAAALRLALPELMIPASG